MIYSKTSPTFTTGGETGEKFLLVNFWLYRARTCTIDEMIVPITRNKRTSFFWLKYLSSVRAYKLLQETSVLKWKIIIFYMY